MIWLLVPLTTLCMAYVCWYVWGLGPNIAGQRPSGPGWPPPSPHRPSPQGPQPLADWAVACGWNRQPDLDRAFREELLGVPAP